MLNMFKYDGYIYLNKQSSEYDRILNVSDAVRTIRSLYKLLSSSSGHCQTFKTKRFAKGIILECKSGTRNVSEQGKSPGTRALR